MRYAIVTDVHNDVPALRAVLDAVARQKVDRLLSLGDVFDCKIGKKHAGAHVFTRSADVFDATAELPSLLAGALLVRGNQEERIRALVPEHALPSHAMSILDAPRVHRTAFADYAHGHAVDGWREVEPGRWCLLDARFAGRLLVHGHHHRSALYSFPADGAREWASAQRPPIRFGEPVVLSPDRRHVANVGPVRGAEPHWAIVDEADETITYHRCERSA